MLVIMYKHKNNYRNSLPIRANNPKILFDTVHVVRNYFRGEHFIVMFLLVNVLLKYVVSVQEVTYLERARRFGFVADRNIKRSVA
jgi:thiosulfate reductase cytochrome b subunit